MYAEYATRAVTPIELLETFRSMKTVMIMSIAMTNLLQYMTMEEVMKLHLDPDTTAVQLGSISMYMSVILILFVGHTLVNRYIYDERKCKAIHEIGKLAVYISYNDIASNSIEPFALTMSVLLPEGTTEEEVELIMKGLSGLSARRRPSIMKDNTLAS